MLHYGLRWFFCVKRNQIKGENTPSTKFGSAAPSNRGQSLGGGGGTKRREMRTEHVAPTKLPNFPEAFAPLKSSVKGTECIPNDGFVMLLWVEGNRAHGFRRRAVTEQVWVSDHLRNVDVGPLIEENVINTELEPNRLWLEQSMESVWLTASFKRDNLSTGMTNGWLLSMTSTAIHCCITSPVVQFTRLCENSYHTSTTTKSAHATWDFIMTVLVFYFTAYHGPPWGELLHWAFEYSQTVPYTSSAQWQWQW